MCDSVMGDLQSLGVSDVLFMLAQERGQWHRLQYKQQPQPAAARGSCANVVGNFAVETTYHDIGNSVKLNDYHRLRRWVSKVPKVCACVHACMCMCVRACMIVNNLALD